MSTPHDFSADALRQPDSQGRIAIGRKHAGEMFAMSEQPNGDILLRPVVVMHKREKWLFENQAALAMVKRGLDDLKQGQLVDRPAFPPLGDEQED